MPCLPSTGSFKHNYNEEATLAVLRTKLWFAQAAQGREVEFLRAIMIGYVQEDLPLFLLNKYGKTDVPGIEPFDPALIAEVFDSKPNYVKG